MYYFTGKELLITLMFSSFDLDGDGYLTEIELDQVSGRDDVILLGSPCSLSSMVQFDEPDSDNVLSIDEFYKAFGKCFLVYSCHNVCVKSFCLQLYTILKYVAVP